MQIDQNGQKIAITWKGSGAITGSDSKGKNDARGYPKHWEIIQIKQFSFFSYMGDGRIWIGGNGS